MLKEFIFKDFPGFRGCHAASITKTRHNGLLVVWFAGTYEGNDDVAIWGSHCLDGNWTAPEMIAKVACEPHWNPVLFDDDHGKLFLFFKVGKHIPSWQTWFMVSNDDGFSWKHPKLLVPGDNTGGRGPVKNKPITLSDGTIIAPASMETHKHWRSFADYSNDDGENWTKSNLICLPEGMCGKGQGVIQPTMWESDHGQVHMLMRSDCGKICRSDSCDNGRTWSSAYSTSLLNNSSGIDLVKLPDGNLALICNPVEDISIRTPLSILLSLDNGINWEKIYDIEDAEVRVGDIVKQDGGEFSYPSMICADGKLMAVYTWHRKRIAFWEAEISELEKLLPIQTVLAG